MKKNKIIEAWRNEEFYLNLSEEERAGLPAHPSGPTTIEDEVLRTITGGCGPATPSTTFCGNVMCL